MTQQGPDPTPLAGVYPHPEEIAAIHASLNGDYSQESIARAVANYYSNQPHPGAPSLKVKDYAAYERVAWMMNDAQPTGPDVAHAAESLNQAGISPSEFEQFWNVGRPVANRLLGRDPSLVEIQRLKDATPSEIHQHYMDHPFPGYEEVTAGEMAKYYRAAEPIARRFGYVPNYEEASRFAIAGYGAEHMEAHYRGDH